MVNPVIRGNHIGPDYGFVRPDFFVRGADLVSVEKSLEFVENFGNLWGQKLNRKKTKVIWLGRCEKKQKQSSAIEMVEMVVQLKS